MVTSTLPELVSALLNPQIYPHPADRVEMAETYISWVFLAGDYAYKIKKPVNYGYLDFTTLEKRAFCCRREVELNRRLCPDIYLGVVPISENWYRGQFAIGSNKNIVEYAVKMKRLPQDRMLDVLLSKNEATPDMMVAVAEKLAEFHKGAETHPEIDIYGHPDEVKRNTDENFIQTEKYIGITILPETYSRIKVWTDDFFRGNRKLFYKRMNELKIRDCHGDVHAQHICFHEGIQIFDCIEFNDKFRYGDVASEVAFLAMDLEHHGKYDLSRAFVDAYVDFSGDKELLKLLDFYKVYRAFVRGKVNSFRLDDPNMPQDERDKALEGAREYFRLAESYIGKEWQE